MTLLESIIASVLLAVTAIVCLDATRGAAQLQRRNEAWTVAVSQAESALALASAGGELPPAEYGDGARVSRYAWRGSPDRVDVIEVEVAIVGGGSYRMTRLVERGR